MRASKTPTTGTEVTVTSRPPSAGPTKKAMLSTVLAVPLAAVSSSGPSTSEGSSAATAGRNGVDTIATTVARATIRMVGAFTAMRPEMTSTSPNLVRSQATITRLRGNRSTSTAANGVTSAIRTSRTVPQMPTSTTPPTP